MATDYQKKQDRDWALAQKALDTVKQQMKTNPETVRVEQRDGKLLITMERADGTIFSALRHKPGTCLEPENDVKTNNCWWGN